MVCAALLHWKAVQRVSWDPCMEDDRKCTSVGNVLGAIAVHDALLVANGAVWVTWKHASEVVDRVQGRVEVGGLPKHVASC